MKDINILREEIDKIDKEITKLFEKRLNVSREILEYKVENNLPVLNQSRENQVIKKNIGYLENPEYINYLEDLYLDIMKMSRDLQYRLSRNLKLGEDYE